MTQSSWKGILTEFEPCWLTYRLRGSVRFIKWRIHTLPGGSEGFCDVSESWGCVQTVATQGQASLPGQLVIVTDKGKTSKEQGNLVVKEAMCAMLQAWHAPFRSAAARAVPCSLP